MTEEEAYEPDDVDVLSSDEVDELLRDLPSPEGLRQREAERREAVARNQAEARPLENDLRSMGFPINELDDLHGENYREAIPLLMEWLPRLSSEDLKEAVVALLGVRWAKPRAARLLISEFRSADEPIRLHHLRWAIADALTTVADDTVLDELEELIRDTRWGRSRQRLALAIANTRHPRAVSILVDMLDDPDVSGHAVDALAKLKPPQARAPLERFLDHPMPWIRKAARRAIDGIDRESR